MIRSGICYVSAHAEEHNYLAGAGHPNGIFEFNITRLFALVEAQDERFPIGRARGSS